MAAMIAVLFGKWKTRLQSLKLSKFGKTVVFYERGYLPGLPIVDKKTAKLSGHFITNNNNQQKS